MAAAATTATTVAAIVTSAQRGGGFSLGAGRGSSTDTTASGTRPATNSRSSSPPFPSRSHQRHRHGRSRPATSVSDCFTNTIRRTPTTSQKKVKKGTKRPSANASDKRERDDRRTDEVHHSGRNVRVSMSAPGTGAATLNPLFVAAAATCGTSTAAVIPSALPDTVIDWAVAVASPGDPRSSSGSRCCSASTSPSCSARDDVALAVGAHARPDLDRLKTVRTVEHRRRDRLRLRLRHRPHGHRHSDDPPHQRPAEQNVDCGDRSQVRHLPLRPDDTRQEVHEPHPEDDQRPNEFDQSLTAPAPASSLTSSLRLR